MFLLARSMVGAFAGVLAAVAGDFGVSESFIAVRVSRYRLIEGGLAR